MIDFSKLKNKLPTFKFKPVCILVMCDTCGFLTLHIHTDHNLCKCVCGYSYQKLLRMLNLSMPIIIQMFIIFLRLDVVHNVNFDN